MTTRTQALAKAAADARNRAGISARLAQIALDRRLTAQGNDIVSKRRFVLDDGPQLINALDSVTGYLDECEKIGITPTPADIRRLIARALGVQS